MRIHRDACPDKYRAARHKAGACKYCCNVSCGKVKTAACVIDKHRQNNPLRNSFFGCVQHVLFPLRRHTRSRYDDCSFKMRSVFIDRGRNIRRRSAQYRADIGGIACGGTGGIRAASAAYGSRCADRHTDRVAGCNLKKTQDRRYVTGRTKFCVKDKTLRVIKVLFGFIFQIGEF